MYTAEELKNLSPDDMAKKVLIHACRKSLPNQADYTMILFVTKTHDRLFFTTHCGCRNSLNQPDLDRVERKRGVT